MALWLPDVPSSYVTFTGTTPTRPVAGPVTWAFPFDVDPATRVTVKDGDVWEYLTGTYGTVAVRGKGSASSAAGNSVSIPPASFDVPPQAGDVLVAFVFECGIPTTAPGGLSTPAGWTRRLYSYDATTAGNGLAIYTRVATASEPTYAWEDQAGTSYLIAEIVALSGADVVTIVDVIGTAGTGSNTTAHAAPDITTKTPGAMLLSGWTGNGYTISTASYTPPATMVELFDIPNTAPASGSRFSASIARQVVTGAGPVGVRTATASTTNVGRYFLAAQVAIRAALTSSRTVRLSRVGGAWRQAEVADVSEFTPCPKTGSNFVVPTEGSVLCTVTESCLVVLKDGVGDQRRVVHVCVAQDSVGGWTVNVAPSTVAWEPTLNTPFASTVTDWKVGAAPTIDTSPNSLTFLRFTWMGSARGWFGEVVPGIAPYTTPVPTAFASQTLYLPGVTMRGTRIQGRDYYLTALTTYVSAAHRQRLATAGLRIEFAELYPTDTLAGAQYRATPYFASTFENAGGFYGAGNTLSFRNYAYLGAGEQSQNTDVALHEYSHAEDNLYYAPGQNVYLSVVYSLISDRPPLVTAHNQVIASGIGQQSRVEWYSQMRRSMRLGGDNARMLTESGNIQSVVDDFIAHINSLGLV